MQYLLARVREASTWAGVAGIVAAFGWQADPQTWGAGKHQPFRRSASAT